MLYYIAGCVFTTRHPALSAAVQKYIAGRGDIQIVRCCVPKYKLREFTEKLPEAYQAAWSALPDSAEFGEGDTVYSLCHNCSAILDEWRPGCVSRSLWELIDGDAEFTFPDYGGLPMYVQDCWRARDRRAEQDAVRSLMRKMNIDIIEMPVNRERTEFCGNSLYRPAPPRNLKLAPRRFVECAAGKFEPHSIEEQSALMREYCAPFGESMVAAYCHYCLEGLLLGGASAVHLAQLLFMPESVTGGGSPR